MVIVIEEGKNYAVRFYYKDCFGKQHRPYKSGFPTERAAKLWEAQEKARLEGEAVSSDDITFGKLYERWYQFLIDKKNASPRTLEKYELYHSYCAKYMDGVPLKKMNEHICQKIVDMHLDSPSTCVELRKLMNAAFNYAKHKRWMRENPIEFVDIPKYKPKKIPAYNFDDIRLLFDTLRNENSKLYTPVLCVCFFAAAREEVCALQETDFVKLKDGTYRLYLDKAVIKVKGRAIIKTQKTENRCRTFVLSESLYKELHSFKLLNGILSPFVCCNKNGSNIQPNTISNSFTLFLKKHHLKKTTFHKLRDAFANACKRLHIDLDTTFRMMGHSSYKVTAEHYATPDEILTAEAVSLIENELLS